MTDNNTTSESARLDFKAVIISGSGGGGAFLLVLGVILVVAMSVRHKRQRAMHTELTDSQVNKQCRCSHFFETMLNSEARICDATSYQDLIASLAVEMDFELSHVHLSQLVDILSLVMTYWWSIGKQLGVSEEELAELKSSTDSEKDQLKYMLDIWLKKSEQKTSIRVLCDALAAVELKDMALDLIYQSLRLSRIGSDCQFGRNDSLCV